MNCVDCRTLLPLRADGSLEPESAAACDEHLARCTECRAEYRRVCALQSQLVAHGEGATDVRVVGPVMNRILGATPESRPARSFKALAGWLLGAGAVAAAAAVVIGVVAFSPKTNAQVVGVMTRGIAAVTKLASVHVQAEMRTPPRDNFSAISPGAAFVPVELWREFEGAKRWRVEKPGRVAAMDGKSTVLFLRPDTALKIDRATRSAFDTDWLQRIADIEQTLTSALRSAQTGAAHAELSKVTGAGGSVDAVVTIETVSALSRGDYLRNAFIGTANLRQVYRFDDASGRLQELQIFLHGDGGDVLIFRTTAIAYDVPVSDATFALTLPADVRWMDTAPKPVAAKYTTLTAETAARMFFEACGREDWDEVAVFWPMPVTDRLKNAFGGLKVVSIGESFASAASPTARFVPYTIKFKSGQEKSFNLALKHDAKTGRWFVDGGL